MVTDAQQTKILRQQRVEEKRQIKELNNTGARLLWVRNKLGLSQIEVSNATKIPPSSLCGREANIRPELVEEFLVLATFFNKCWKKKYSGSYPLYNGEELKSISVEWLIFGHSDIEANAEVIIQEYQIRMKEMEEEFYMKEQELLRQLDLLALISDEAS